jgi:hypothetical protein
MELVSAKKLYPKIVYRAGFEPAPPKREELKSSAIDHSANDTKQNPLRGSNPRPQDYIICVF